MVTGIAVTPPMWVDARKIDGEALESEQAIMVGYNRQKTSTTLSFFRFPVFNLFADIAAPL